MHFHLKLLHRLVRTSITLTFALRLTTGPILLASHQSSWSAFVSQKLLLTLFYRWTALRPGYQEHAKIHAKQRRLNMVITQMQKHFYVLFSPLKSTLRCMSNIIPFNQGSNHRLHRMTLQGARGRKSALGQDAARDWYFFWTIDKKTHFIYSFVFDFVLILNLCKKKKVERTAQNINVWQL